MRCSQAPPEGGGKIEIIETSLQSRLSIQLIHDVDEETRPPSEGMSTNPTPTLVIILLPEVSRGSVLSRDGLEEVRPQLGVQLSTLLTS
jgi:hypothetical protein